MKILFCAAEVHPYSKTGGLADVTGALPLELGRRGHDVLVVTPQYKGQSGLRSQRLSPRVEVRFVEHPAFFHREGIYGNAEGDYPDNAARFSYLCHEALKEARRTNFRPDIAHVHDWHTGPLAMILKTLYAGDSFFGRTRSLFTIHNLAYQGLFPSDRFFELGVGPAPRAFRACEFWGKVSYIKSGLEFADAINAVSPTYAREIQTKRDGCGLDAVLRRRRKVLRGILNGIDTAMWDPARDRSLKKNYSLRTLGDRAVNRAELLRSFGLADSDESRNPSPIFGVVSRLVEQKGMDLLVQAFDGLMKRGVRFVLLGTGEKKYEDFFKKAQKRYPRQAACVLQFSGAQASLIYAGSDFFLMPSRFEPCGLGQLISFRYGAVPVVHKTGGLADTVRDADANASAGNGIAFDSYRADDLLEAVDRSIRLFRNPEAFDRVRRRGMKQVFSWKTSAREYEALYRAMLGVRS